MSKSRTPSKSMGGFLGFVILAAIMMLAGPTVCFVLGGLSLLGGWGALGDRRRNPFTGFGLMAFGVVLLLCGLVRLAYTTTRSSSQTYLPESSSPPVPPRPMSTPAPAPSQPMSAPPQSTQTSTTQLTAHDQVKMLWKQAAEKLHNGDRSGAIKLLEAVLTLEPENKGVREKLTELESQYQKEK